MGNFLCASVGGCASNALRWTSPLRLTSSYFSFHLFTVIVVTQSASLSNIIFVFVCVAVKQNKTVQVTTYLHAFT
jgi:hypothetical protein